MRILFILTQDLYSPSGGGRYFPLAKELALLNNKVRIIATHSNFKNLKEKKVIQDGVEVNYVGQMHVLKSGNTKKYFNPIKLISNTISSTLFLSLSALSKRADIIFVGKPHPMNSVAGLVGRIRWGCSLVIDVDDDEAASNNIKMNWEKKIVAWFAWQAPRWANWVTTNTHYMANKLQRAGIDSKRIYYLPNGIDPDCFREPDPQTLANLRFRLGLSDKKVIAYIGSISLTNHPIDLLISAFNCLRLQREDIILMIVGGGEDFEPLQEIIKKNGQSENVLFTGKVPKEDINLYYRLADVSVDPVFDNEVARCRCPLKLFESWACGIPFITADVGERKQLMGPELEALNIIPGSSSTLCLALCYVLDNPQLMQELCNNARDKVQKYYWRVLASQLSERIKALGENNSIQNQ